MSNLFKSAGARIRGSPFIVVIWLVFVGLLIVSCSLLFEAYSTSLLGYEMLRTRKVNDWVIPMVAALPILGQIALSYVFLNDTAKRWAGVLAFILHLADMGTDVLYKINGSTDLGLIIVAFIESEVLFTIGAIMGFTFSAGMLLVITPDALAHMGSFGDRMMKSLGIGESDEHEKAGSGSQSGANDPLSGLGNQRRNP